MASRALQGGRACEVLAMASRALQGGRACEVLPPLLSRSRNTGARRSRNKKSNFYASALLTHVQRASPAPRCCMLRLWQRHAVRLMRLRQQYAAAASAALAVHCRFLLSSFFSPFPGGARSRCVLCLEYSASAALRRQRCVRGSATLPLPPSIDIAAAQRWRVLAHGRAPRCQRDVAAALRPRAPGARANVKQYCGGLDAAK